MTNEHACGSLSQAQHVLQQVTGAPLTLGNLLWSIRRCDEVSQVAMAERLGVSRAHLCDIEKGRRFVSPARAAQWAKLLGHHPGQFVRLSLQDQLRQAGLPYMVHVEAAEGDATQAA